MSADLLPRYRRISLYFAGWTGLLKLAFVMPVLVFVTLLFVLPPMSLLLGSAVGHAITVAWLFETAPLSMWALFVGSIFVGWIYFWCERHFFDRLLGPPGKGAKSS